MGPHTSKPTIRSVYDPDRQSSECMFFEKTCGIFRFVNLPMEIPDKTMLHPCKTLLYVLKIPRPKPKTHGKSTWPFFLITLEFLLLSFDWPMEFPHAISPITLKIPPCPQPLPLFRFFLQMHFKIIQKCLECMYDCLIWTLYHEFTMP